MFLQIRDFAMKRLFQKIPSPILSFLLAIIFLTTWPILLVVVGVKTLFGNKASESEKIAGAKAAVLTLLGILATLIVAIYEHQLRLFFSLFPLEAIFAVLLVGLIILSISQKIFPGVKWLQQKDDNS
jgi:membrane protease YdiL (CAAX protease family)